MSYGQSDSASEAMRHVLEMAHNVYSALEKTKSDMPDDLGDLCKFDAEEISHHESALVPTGYRNKPIPAMHMGAGNLKTCPGCGTSAEVCYSCSQSFDSVGPSNAKYCGPGKRLRLKWWSLERCSIADKHFHQKCRTCGFEWTTAFS